MRQRGHATWPWMEELDAGLSLITSGKAPFSRPSQAEKQLPWTLDPEDSLFLLDEAMGAGTGSRKEIQPLWAQVCGLVWEVLWGGRKKEGLCTQTSCHSLAM